jgi:hypothetical protein
MKDQPQRLLETVADIAYLAGAKRFHSGDSREDVTYFISLAEQFETLRRVDANEVETYNGKDYLTAIEEFAFEKLNLRHDDHCPVCACNVHGRVTAAMNHLKRGAITKSFGELGDLLKLCKPT